MPTISRAGTCPSTSGQEIQSANEERTTGRLRRFTPTAQRVMKVIPTDVGRPLGDIKFRVDAPDLEQRVLNAIDRLAASDQEVRDDEGRWWSMTIRPYQNVERKVDGAVLVFTDIDASKRYGERAEEASEARRQLLVVSAAARVESDHAKGIAESANQAKSSFLASVSHELRTPLNAIMGFLELLEMELRGPVTETQHEDFTRIRRSALHLLSLINDILNFAKLEAGQVEVRLVDVAVANVIAQLEELMVPQFEARSLSYERPEWDGTVRADPEKLLQILLNLVGNAVKFTKAGGRIAIRCSGAEESTRIDVIDTGVGIPAEQLERIFEPFVQVNRSLTSVGNDGVGLGLAISRDLARRMGGDLTVESTLGEGSRLSIILRTSGVASVTEVAEEAHA